MKRHFSRAAARCLYPLVRGAGGIRILCYHAINDAKPDYMNVTPGAFAEQMAWLHGEGYRTVGLDSLFGASTAGRDRAIILTFDDGYADNYEQAFPVMRRYGFTGTIFCVSSRVGQPLYLSPAQIHEMQQAGFAFGSHTVSHPRLPQLPAADKRREFTESRKALEQLTGREVPWFCYPYGMYDAECFGLLAEAGYKGAVCNAPGANHPGSIPDPYALRRTEIGGFDTLEDFRLKTAGAFDWLHTVLHTLRGRP